jgi:cyclophilin family peptidyl-prolyl cis-trans isomerase
MNRIIHIVGVIALVAVLMLTACAKAASTTISTVPTTTRTATTTTTTASTLFYGTSTTTTLASSTSTSRVTTTTSPVPPTTTSTGASTVKKYSAPPPMTIDTKKTYTATIHTSKGDITLNLFASEAPITVNNFVFLARDGFYNNVIFHRVIKGFMIQGGDPTGTGTGSPGYKFADEPVTRKYLRGTIAMANSGPNTNGSQFFIMHQDYALQPNYTIFGIVTKGIEVVDAIATTPTVLGGDGAMSKPATPIVISSIDITEQ